LRSKKQAVYGASYSSVGDSLLIESGIGSGSAKLELITLENTAQSIAYESAKKFLDHINRSD
jgi:precorrin-6B methylase 2